MDDGTNRQWISKFIHKMLSFFLKPKNIEIWNIKFYRLPFSGLKFSHPYQYKNPKFPEKKIVVGMLKRVLESLESWQITLPRFHIFTLAKFNKNFKISKNKIPNANSNEFFFVNTSVLSLIPPSNASTFISFCFVLLVQTPVPQNRSCGMRWFLRKIPVQFFVVIDFNLNDTFRFVCLSCIHNQTSIKCCYCFPMLLSIWRMRSN